MPLDVKIEKKRLNFTNEKKEIYVATANRGSVIDTKKMAEEISDETGYKPVVVRTILSNLCDRMVKWMEEGHGIRFDGFGSFMPAVRSQSSEDAGKVGVKRVRVSFFPSRALSQKVNAISIRTEDTGGEGDDVSADNPG